MRKTKLQKIIEGGYIYADKTGHILRMLQSYQCVFLSRPRRFGKSLLLSTLEELFRGNRELFQDLSIESSGYDFAPHPVIQLSMKFDRKDFSDNKASPDVTLGETSSTDLRKLRRTKTWKSRP
jgi:hypothetical protein